MTNNKEKESMESHDPHVLKGHGKIAGDKRIFKDRVNLFTS